MLAADKLQLQSSLKQQATALKEKEFNLHHSNLSKNQKTDKKFIFLNTNIFWNNISFTNYNFIFPHFYFFAVTVGTQAAVLAGLDITMFIEFNPHADADWVRLVCTVSMA